VLVEWSGRGRRRARPVQFAAAALLFLVPTLAWAVARWRVDGGLFFLHMLQNDLVSISLKTLDGHDGSVFFYLHTLQKNQFEWLIAAFGAFCLLPPTRAGLRTAWRTLRTDETWRIIAAWAVVVVLIPTAMQTKLPWYLNPFYPIFALGIALSLARTLSPQRPASHVRVVATWALAALALMVTEARLITYSYLARDVDRHAQGLLLAEPLDVRGRRVFHERWDHADRFVLRSIRADAAIAAGLDDFIAQSAAGDYLVAGRELLHPDLRRVRANERYVLYERADAALSLSD
jgi:4-amino-4-deoxy-L-arabinose transferase-like glycosyltransferase